LSIVNRPQPMKPMMTDDFLEVPDVEVREDDETSRN
jgi:hypothetical protein